MKSTSTLVEVLSRGKIHEIQPSSLRSNIFIVIFVLGDQANIDRDTYYKLVGA